MSIREFESRLNPEAKEDALFVALRELRRRPEALRSIAREAEKGVNWQPWPSAG